MIVSTRGEYALRLMIALAGKEGPSPLKEIALENNIPHKYSESIMSALAKAGLVEGSRGKNGGYRLTRAPAEYSVSEILEAAETSFFVTSCSKDNSCPHADTCPTLPIWKALDGTVREFLSRYTLADLLTEPKRIAFPQKI